MKEVQPWKDSDLLMFVDGVFCLFLLIVVNSNSVTDLRSLETVDLLHVVQSSFFLLFLGSSATVF